MDKILTLDVGATKIRIQTVNKSGDTGREYLISPIDTNIDNDGFLKLLTDNIKLSLEDEKDAKAISIGIPGRVDQAGGVIKKMPNIPKVVGLSLVEELKKEFGLPVYLLNDADAGALGELHFGTGKGFKNLIYIALGSGVGSGVIKEGSLITGSELGHTPLAVTEEKRQCSCGKEDCAESFLGTHGLAVIYSKIFNSAFSELSSEDIRSISPTVKKGIVAGDKNCEAVFSEYAGYLAAFIKNISVAYHPEIIILGGGIAAGNEALLNLTKKNLGNDNLLALAKFQNAGNLGAAAYAFQQMEG